MYGAGLLIYNKFIMSYYLKLLKQIRKAMRMLLQMSKLLYSNYFNGFL